MIIDCREAGKNVSALAREMGMPIQTAKRIVSRYMHEDVREPRPRGGPNTSFPDKPAMMEVLTDWLKRDPRGDVSSRSAEAELLAHFVDHVPTPATIAKWLEGELIFFNKHFAAPVSAQDASRADTIFIAELALGLWTKMKGSTQADGLVKETVVSPTTVFLAVNPARGFAHFDVLPDHSSSAAYSLFTLNVMRQWQMQHAGQDCVVAIPAACASAVKAALVDTNIAVVHVDNRANCAAQVFELMEAMLRSATARASKTGLAMAVAAALAKSPPESFL